MKIDDHVTYIGHEEDRPYLLNRFLGVNMRLYNSSEHYRTLIGRITDYIATMCATKFEDYKKPHGFSGANAGIPINIIAIMRDRGTANEWVEIMMNPNILNYDPPEGGIATMSNCGSLRLAEPIKVGRRTNIEVEWYDEAGEYHKEWRTPETGSLTIQHEVDHNRGILITQHVIS